MALLDGGLKAVFGAALAALYDDATLHLSALSVDGPAGFAVSATDQPVKVMLAASSERERAQSGLADSAISVSILLAGLAVPPDLGDVLTLAGRSYRLVRVETDPAGAAMLCGAVPV